MVGTATRPSPSPSQSQSLRTAAHLLRPSLANIVRINAVMERLRLYLSLDTGPASDGLYASHEFQNLCLSLSRGIDYAVANNEVPDTNQEMLPMVKQICKRKREDAYQAHLMVLLVSIKNACKMGWFSERDRQEFMDLIDEVSSSFCSPGDINSGTGNSLSIISTVIARYYPQFKLSHMLTSLEIKSGYGAFISDFHISKSTPHTASDKIMFFVLQTDKMETSACIISPQQVNFLLNGRGVEKRCLGNMDTGPQLPTEVTKMLKYGTNLLQAVGQFTGDYLIVIAFMSTMPPPNHPVLEDYVPRMNKASESDPDIIEGQSRITLNCPISHSRIKLPVKGERCRHLQCYDFSNFVVINSRRPSWRCPHCNQHVCYTDIRVDQNIAKILKEVGDDVTEVMISADGSWKAIMDSNDDSDFDCQKEGSVQQGPIGSPKSASVFVDLTEDQGEMDVDVTFEEEDRKPPKLDDLTQDVASNPVMSAEPENAGTTHGGAQDLDDFWAGILCSTLNAPNAGNSRDPSPLNISNTPVQSQFPSASNMQIQRSQVVNSVATEHGNMPSLIPSNITRIPNAIQALPVQMHSQSLLQRSRSNANPVVPGASPMATPETISSGLTAGVLRGSEMQRHQQLLRSRINSSHGLNTTPPLNRSFSMQDRSSSPSQLNQQFMGNRPSGTLPDLHRPPGFFSGFQNAHLQQALNSGYSMPTSQSPNISRFHRPQAAVTPTSVAGGAQHSRTPVSLQHAVYTSSQANPVALQSPSRDNDSVNLPSEENWRPAGQMRGSLRLNSDALSHLIIQPTHTAQAIRPSSGPPSSNTTAQATRPPSGTPSSNTTAQATRPPSGTPSSNTTVQATQPPSVTPSTNTTAQATRPPLVTPASNTAAEATRLPSGTPLSNTSAQATRPPSVTPLSSTTAQATRPPSVAPLSSTTAQATRPPSVAPFGSTTAQATRTPSVAPLSSTTAQAAIPPSGTPAARPPLVTPLSTPTSRVNRPPVISQLSISNAQAPRPPSVSPLTTTTAQAARPPSISPLSTSGPQTMRPPSISPLSGATAPPHLQCRPPSTISTAPPHLQARPPSTITSQLSHLPGHSLSTLPAPPHLQDLSSRTHSAPSNENSDIGHAESTQ